MYMREDRQKRKDGSVVTYLSLAHNVWVSDAHNGYGAPPVPAGEALTGDGGMPGDSSDTSANDGNWAVLAPGDTVTFAANYTVVQADVDNLQ